VFIFFPVVTLILSDYLSLADAHIGPIANRRTMIFKNAFKLLSEAIGPVLSKASQESEPIRTLRQTNSGAFS